LRFPYNNVNVTNQFKTTFAYGEGALISLVEVTFPNYVQEFGLCTKDELGTFFLNENIYSIPSI
jgi:hypothetical protein